MTLPIDRSDLKVFVWNKQRADAALTPEEREDEEGGYTWPQGRPWDVSVMGHGEYGGAFATWQEVAAAIGRAAGDHLRARCLAVQDSGRGVDVWMCVRLECMHVGDSEDENPVSVPPDADAVSPARDASVRG